MPEPTGEGEVQIVHPRHGEDHPAAAQAFGSPGAGGERVPKSPSRGGRQAEGGYSKYSDNFPSPYCCSSFRVSWRERRTRTKVSRPRRTLDRRWDAVVCAANYGAFPPWLDFI